MPQVGSAMWRRQVASDVSDVSGRAYLVAPIAGSTTRKGIATVDDCPPTTHPPMSSALVLHERRKEQRPCRRYIAPSARETVQSAASKFQQLDSNTVAIISALGGTALTLGALALRKRWKRIRNADGVPPRLLDKQGTIVGVVTR